MPTSLPYVILLVLVFFIVLFGVYVLRYRKDRFNKADKRYLKRHWQELSGLADEHPDQAVLKADKLLDFALKKAGYQGTLGEKMKQARAVFRDNNGLWSAHKLRNRIAHEVGISVSSKQAKTALAAFKKAFFDLGISL